MMKAQRMQVEYNPQEKVAKFYREHHQNLFRKVARRIGNPSEAQDVVHEAFLKATNYADRWDYRRGKFSKWFNGILENTIRDYRKAQQRDVLQDYIDVDEEEEIQDFLASHDESPHLKEEYNRVLRIVENKADPTRQILYMYYFLDHTPTEIAETLEINVNAVKVSVWRFKQEMQK